MTTAAVLMGGLVAFKKGNKALSQTMMRARIIAQGGTVAIMLATSGTEPGFQDSLRLVIFFSGWQPTPTHLRHAVCLLTSL